MTKNTNAGWRWRPNVSDNESFVPSTLCLTDLKADTTELPQLNPPHEPPPSTAHQHNMFHTSRSEKSKAALKPQPAQRYHHPNADHADHTDEMEVDSLITPKANHASVANTTLATQPVSPTPQPASGSVSKALPLGLSFSKVVATGTLSTLPLMNIPKLTRYQETKARRGRVRQKIPKPPP